MLVDQRDRTYLMTLQAGGTYHTHSGTLAARRPARQARRHARGDVEGHGDDGVPPAVRGLRAEDAARRAGGVSEGPGADHDVRGHLSPARACWRRGPVRARSRSRCAARPGPTGASSRTTCARITAIKPSRTSRRSSGSSPISSSCAMEMSRTSSRTGDRFDRCVLDLPEPWRPLGALHRCWSRGACSARTCPPRSRCRSSCSRCSGNGFQHVETFETLRRSWHVTERSVRPDHRMVGHTGFLTIARRVGGDRLASDPRTTRGQRYLGSRHHRSAPNCRMKG